MKNADDKYTHYDARGDSEYACGGDDDCTSIEAEPECVDGFSHRWTRQGCGGCDGNPGVWSLGGTTHQFSARCRLCGCGRSETTYGSQRNPGQCDEVSYCPDEYEPELDALRHARALRRTRRRYTIRAARDLYRRLPLVLAPDITPETIGRVAPRVRYAVLAEVARLARGF